MKRSSFLFSLFGLAIGLSLSAQTNPTAVSLPFSLNSQSSSTLPSGVAVHRFSSIPTTRTLLPASGGDLPNGGNTAAGTTGGWYNLSADGIGLLASTSNPAGAVIVAINTTGLSNISVSWICKTIKNQSSRDNSMALQYRVGTSGNFTDVGTTSVYTSAGQADGSSSSLFTEILPAGANNQSVVQVRWIYWESVSTSGSRDKISVDQISITSSTTSCNPVTGLSATGVTTASAAISWSTVSGASSYEYSLSASATPPSSGTSINTTTYAASSLTCGTTYYFHVRSVCTGSTFSSWSTATIATPSCGGEEGEFVFMSYNLLNYPGSSGSSREPAYRTIIDSVQPDILAVQELSSASGIGNFLNNVLNFSGSAYSQGTFINGPDSDNGIYYKSSKFQFISNTAIATDLRDINQFTLKHIASGDTLIVFSAHLKASNTPADEAQRALEVDSLRKVTNALAAGKYFLVCGDFNIYGSSETAYQNLISNGSNANGKFNDIISMSGTWNNSSYAINHTQSPRTTSFGGGATGGMDDRFDMILFSTAIISPGGFDIVSGTYKAFGNDGAHYNQALNTPPYTMYSSTVATAVHDASDHVPVVVKLSHSGSGSRMAVFQSPVPVTAKNTKEEISIYPNPAHSVFFVKANTVFAEPAQFLLYDLNGKCIQQASLKGDIGQTTSFDVSHLTPGIYTVKWNGSNKVYKIVVE